MGQILGPNPKIWAMIIGQNVNNWPKFRIFGEILAKYIYINL